MAYWVWLLLAGGLLLLAWGMIRREYRCPKCGHSAWLVRRDTLQQMVPPYVRSWQDRCVKCHFILRDGPL
jgi:uncharacterized protein with PIN domain